MPSSTSATVDEYYPEPISLGGGDSEGPWSPANHDDLTSGLHTEGLERTSGENLLFTLQYNSSSFLEDKGMFTPSACSGGRQVAAIGDNQPDPGDNPRTSGQHREQEERECLQREEEAQQAKIRAATQAHISQVRDLYYRDAPGSLVRAPLTAMRMPPPRVTMVRDSNALPTPMQEDSPAERVHYLATTIACPPEGLTLKQGVQVMHAIAQELQDAAENISARSPTVLSQTDSHLEGSSIGRRRQSCNYDAPDCHAQDQGEHDTRLPGCGKRPRSPVGHNNRRNTRQCIGPYA